jgi:hypothetical protein
VAAKSLPYIRICTSNTEPQDTHHLIGSL